MEPNQRKPGNYLVFDGGRSALSQLHIIEEICARLQFDADSDDEVRISDHCDLLGGSGPGAAAAILLGRMGLKSSQAIDAYLKLESALSVQPTTEEDERRRNTDAFKKAFTEVLEEAGFTANTPMLDKTAPKTVVWTLSAANLSASQPIRSYRVRSAPDPPCTILEAACASIASPDKFLPVTIGSGHKRIVLVDAMAGYANPTKELLKEAQGLFGDDAGVASIVSLGAGKEEALSISGIVDEDGLLDALRRTALDSERSHEEMYDRLRQLSVYFRFNIERGLERQNDATSIYERTKLYMREGLINQLLDNVVKNIKGRPNGSSLSDINSVTAVEITMKPRPSLVENFVGREEILNVLKTTHFSSRSLDLRRPAVSILMGLGGSGKTQIALKFALEYEERDRNASVYFFNASSEDKLKADFELAIRARDSASRSKSHDDAVVWFATRKDNWLIIMDNADNPSVELFRFIPKSGHGNVIITTRNATYKTFAPNSSHHVEGLASSDAVELILKGASYGDNEENKAHARGIAKALGHLPLALAHATGYISVHRCLSTYLSMFRRSQAKFLASKPALAQDYTSTIGTTMQISLDSIPPVACDVMVLLSRFDISSIPQSIIMKSAERQFQYIDGGCEGEDLDAKTIGQANALTAILCPSGEWLEFDFNEIIEQCLKYSLLQVTTHGEDKFYSMHVLVQAYLQSTTASIREHQVERLVVRLLSSAITIDHHYKYFAFNRLLFPHLKLIAIDHVMEAGDHLGLGQVLREQGNARLSSEHFERCFALRKGSLGNDNLYTLAAMGHLAYSYREMGRRREALELEVEVLDLRKRVLGEEHPDTMISMGNVATYYSDLGRYKEALELEIEVLDLRKRLFGDEYSDTVLAMSNLSSSYRDVGRYKEALELRVKALDLRRRMLGDEHPHTMAAMGSLALSYNDMGRHREAVELQMKVLDLRKRLSGDEHPETVMAMGSLAVCYRGLGEHKEALELEEKVLEMRTKLLGEEHPDTLLSMQNLSITLHQLGEKERAIALLQVVMPLQEKALGIDHPRTIEMKASLHDFLKDSQ